MSPPPKAPLAYTKGYKQDEVEFSACVLERGEKEGRSRERGLFLFFFIFSFDFSSFFSLDFFVFIRGEFQKGGYFRA